MVYRLKRSSPEECRKAYIQGPSGYRVGKLKMLWRTIYSPIASIK